MELAGAGLLASGADAAPSQEPRLPVADFRTTRQRVTSGLPAALERSTGASCDAYCPVTVAGPRRFLTGLPLTTGLCGGQSTAAPGREPGPRLIRVAVTKRDHLFSRPTSMGPWGLIGRRLKPSDSLR